MEGLENKFFWDYIKVFQYDALTFKLQYFIVLFFRPLYTKKLNECKRTKHDEISLSLFSVNVTYTPPLTGYILRI